jgi:hypothetical protein
MGCDRLADPTAGGPDNSEEIASPGRGITGKEARIADVSQTQLSG